MSLLALCYPELRVEDQRFIDGFRDQHDLPYREVVRAHFTTVFQVRGLAEPVFTEHVPRVAETPAPFRFVCAMR